MSGANDKNSKINRLLLRQRGDRLDILEVLRLSREMQDLQRRRIHDQTGALVSIGNSLKLATETAARLEAENARLRKYLGGVLFERRQREMQIPTLGQIQTLGQIRCAECGSFEGAHATGCPELKREPGEKFRWDYPRPPICSCPPGVCKGSVINVTRCRHCLAPSTEPKFGNRA